MKKTKTLGLILVGVLTCLVSCNNPNITSLEVGMSRKTLENYLKDKRYIELNKTYILNENSTNYVIEVNPNDKVESLVEYPAVSFSEEEFVKVDENYSLQESVKYLSMPKYIGLSNTNSLDFGVLDQDIFRIHYQEKDGKLMFNSKEQLDHLKPQTWFDENKTALPSSDDVEPIKIGMSIDTVVSLIGKPQRDVGYGAFIFEFDMKDGKVFRTYWLLENTRYEPYSGTYLNLINFLTNSSPSKIDENSSLSSATNSESSGEVNYFVGRLPETATFNNFVYELKKLHGIGPNNTKLDVLLGYFVNEEDYNQYSDLEDGFIYEVLEFESNQKDKISVYKLSEFEVEAAILVKGLACSNIYTIQQESI